MSSRSEKLWVALGLVVVTAGAVGLSAARATTRPPLRVCADPNNLPFSNEAEEGFENRIAEVVAEAMGRDLEYTWWPQRMGFIRHTLRAERCDVVMGLPTSFELALTTAPYYRSTYVFVYRADRDLEIRSMDDPVLRELRIGVHMVGDDYSNTPGAAALGRRGMIDNLVGYSIYGDYSKPHPPSRLIEAVADGEIDVAIAWGPMAGYFGARQPVPLEIVPVTPQIDLPFTPFVFDIGMGVRRGDDSLRVALDRVLEDEAPAIRSILTEYGVPLVGSGRTGGQPTGARE